MNKRINTGTRHMMSRKGKFHHLLPQKILPNNRHLTKTVRSNTITRDKRKSADYQPDEFDARTPQEREATGERFTDNPFSYLWHADGTPYTDEEYLTRGIEPPTPGEQNALIILD